MSRIPPQPDSAASWLRLALALVLSTIGGVGMWSVVVALPAVQADFGSARADASLPYTLAMIGFAAGGIGMGRLADRFGIVVPVIGSAVALGIGYVAAAAAPNLTWFALAHGLLIGVASSATFGPMMADVSQWFVRRRGIAVAVCASGNYLAGTFWPPVLQHFFDTVGWRQTHLGIALFCTATMLPLAFLLRGTPPARSSLAADGLKPASSTALGLSPGTLLAVLAVAGVACCVAMAMPQVHIVAYCGDLGYGVARGAEMLSLMLGFGIVSRIASGFIADRIGGIATLLLGSGLQGVALLLYLAFDGMTSLYVISALFGLFQGGIVPSYAIIVREYFPAREAATRLGVVLMATLVGMAFGGWLSGAIFDLTGSYKAAFLNGTLWNLVNFAIVAWLMMRSTWRMRLQGSAA
jgi:MFS family permease